jgi:hypothetical protein
MGIHSAHGEKIVDQSDRIGQIGSVCLMSVRTDREYLFPCSLLVLVSENTASLIVPLSTSWLSPQLLLVDHVSGQSPLTLIIDTLANNYDSHFE